MRLLVRMERPRPLCAAIVLGLVVSDAVAAHWDFFSESLLVMTRLKLSWAVPIRSALRHSVFWHLGFWEWTGAVAVFVFLCAAVFLTPPRISPSRIDSLNRDEFKS
jgi:hypothetical protein